MKREAKAVAKIKRKVNAAKLLIYTAEPAF